MNFSIFKKKLSNLPSFSRADIRAVFPHLTDVQLSRWVQSGALLRLRRGHYVFGDTPVRGLDIFVLANRIYAPSYISLESALEYYGLIPEAVFATTSVSTRKTAAFNTEFGMFSYTSIAPRLHFGYVTESTTLGTCNIASIEKCVLDYLYAHPEVATDAGAYQEWRFNTETFLTRADLQVMRTYATRFGTTFSVRTEQLIKRITTTH